MTTKTNLVLGFATNQSADDLTIFVNSLRRVYSPAECDLVLIGEKPDGMLAKGVTFASTINTYSSRPSVKRKAQTALIRAASKLKGRAPGASAALKLMMERWHHPCFARWLAYRRFLSAHPEYDQVLLTDVRDVLFQRPFFSNRVDRVHFFDQSAVYGVDRCDTDWYRDGFGEDGLARVAGKPAICAGTVLGPRQALIEFIDEFVSWFAEAPYRTVDQANLNALLLEGRPSFRYHVNENGTGLISTLGNAKALATVWVEGSNIVNLAGAVVPVVHMYDRHPATKAAARVFL